MYGIWEHGEEERKRGIIAACVKSFGERRAILVLFVFERLC
jgi:hypothetical protein